MYIRDEGQRNGKILVAGVRLRGTAYSYATADIGEKYVLLTDDGPAYHAIANGSAP